MKHLYFVRHGLSEMNKQGFYSGRTETPLAPEGKSQAKLAGEEAKKLHIDLVVSSPLKRARDTAKIIAKEIGYPEEAIVLDEQFIERHFGVLEGTPYDGARDIDHHEGVEKDAEILERARKGLEYIQTLGHDNILIVAHGAIGRALRHIIDPSVHFHDIERFENGKIVQLL